jgi:hypothetical protein
VTAKGGSIAIAARVDLGLLGRKLVVAEHAGLVQLGEMAAQTDPLIGSVRGVDAGVTPAPGREKEPRPRDPEAFLTSRDGSGGFQTAS